MNRDTVQLVATYVIALLILAGSFALIWQGRGDTAQAWLAIGAVMGYVFRDAAGNAATRNAERIATANTSPTV